MSLRLAPSDFLMPISFVRSVTEDKHDVHNHNSADDQSYGRHDYRDEKDRTKDTVAQARDRIRRDDSEVVLFTWTEPSACTH